MRERSVEFDCEGSALFGMLAEPASQPAQRGVVIVVGGPQIRIGSHRQFVLLSRRLARAGYAVLRFDLRGMGDSEGDPVGFERSGPDLTAALDALFEQVPTLRDAAVWGLCDAASAALMHASRDVRVRTLILLNPWARSSATLASTQLKHYYVRRVLDRTFWRKLAEGAFDWRAAIGGVAQAVRAALGPRHPAGAYPDLPFQIAMARGLRDFRGRVLLILSGQDLTAREFLEYVNGAHEWRGLLDGAHVRSERLAEADHTFSRAEWRARVEDLTLDFLGAAVLRPPASP